MRLGIEMVLMKIELVTEVSFVVHIAAFLRFLGSVVELASAGGYEGDR